LKKAEGVRGKFGGKIRNRLMGSKKKEFNQKKGLLSIDFSVLCLVTETKKSETVGRRGGD